MHRKVMMNNGLTEDDLSRFCDSFQVNSKGCWIWQLSKEGNGYGRFGISNKRRYTLSAHRASWMLFRGPLAPKQFVNHKCDVKACCNPSHLYLGDHETNMADRTLRQRHPKHISDETIFEIHNDYHRGLSDYKALVDKYGVCRETIKRIVHQLRPRYKKLLYKDISAVNKKD